MAQLDLQHVMFRTPVYPDLIAGRVTMCFCNIAQALPLARENKLRALAVTSSKRSPAAPELPTIDELRGFPGFDVTSWFALMAPAGTPQPIIDKLHQEVVRILAMPDIRQKLSDLGMEVVGNSPTELAEIIKRAFAASAPNSSRRQASNHNTYTTLETKRRCPSAPAAFEH